MKSLKKILIILIYVIGITSLFVFYDTINEFIINNFLYKKELKPLITNEYSKKENYDYLKISENFRTKNLVDIINNIYTIVDSGMEEYSFYCDEKYEKCISDVEKLSDNSNLLTIINNYVSPYNSFNKLYISSNTMGKITVNIDKLYSAKDIEYVNDSMNKIMSEIITEDMSNKEKIKAIHDYIINNTSYDEEKSNEIKDKVYITNTNHSHKATGLYSNHLALCSGYTDTMALYLNILGIKNYKISTEDHIWNALYLDDNWYHLDLTWDDPITNDNREILIYDFFLINDENLYQKKTSQHAYDRKIYTEIATANIQ